MQENTSRIYRVNLPREIHRAARAALIALEDTDLVGIRDGKIIIPEDGDLDEPRATFTQFEAVEDWLLQNAAAWVEEASKHGDFTMLEAWTMALKAI